MVATALESDVEVPAIESVVERLLQEDRKTKNKEGKDEKGLGSEETARSQDAIITSNQDM